MAAFAGEMADAKGGGAGKPALGKSGGCEKYFKLKGWKFRKAGTGTCVLSTDPSTTLSLPQRRLSFHLSFCQTVCPSITVEGALTTEDKRRRRNLPDFGRGWWERLPLSLWGWGCGGGDYLRVSLTCHPPGCHSPAPPPALLCRPWKRNGRS